MFSKTEMTTRQIRKRLSGLRDQTGAHVVNTVSDCTEHLTANQTSYLTAPPYLGTLTQRYDAKLGVYNCTV